MCIYGSVSVHTAVYTHPNRIQRGVLGPVCKLKDWGAEKTEEVKRLSKLKAGEQNQPTEE